MPSWDNTPLARENSMLKGKIVELRLEIETLINTNDNLRQQNNRLQAQNDELWRDNNALQM